MTQPGAQRAVSAHESIFYMSEIPSHFLFGETSVEPTDVFCLLETLYRNFDFIAKKRRVYKVCMIASIGHEIFIAQAIHAHMHLFLPLSHCVIP